MTNHTFGFDVAERFLPHMRGLVRDPDALGGFSRKVDRLWLDNSSATRHLGPPAASEVCETCLDKAMVLYLLTSPPGGRGWLPGSLSGALILVASVDEPPLVSGRFHPAEPSSVGKCPVCGGSGPLFDEVHYRATGKQKETRWTVPGSTPGRRFQWREWHGHDGPELAWTTAGRSANDRVLWLQVLAKQASTEVLASGSFNGTVTPSRVEFLTLTQRCRVSLAHAVADVRGFDASAMFDIRPATALSDAWALMEEHAQAGDGPAEAALRAFDDLCPMSPDMPLKRVEALALSRARLQRTFTAETKTEMTPGQFQEGRQRLDLTHEKLATLMGVSPRIVKAWCNKRTPTGPAVRLMQAYLSGYRPDDWPE